MKLQTREWGQGRPVVALHPLGLESSAFEGVARSLGKRGCRTIAVDLPGFGRTASADRPLSPPVLAEPVIELARGLRDRPVVIGISMGGRVALEAAFRAPEALAAVVPIAPFLPWRSWRPLLELARLMSPAAAERIPLQGFRPVLAWISRRAQDLPLPRDEALAGARVIHDFASPAMRASIVSASREMALDPAFGPEGVWTRLPGLAVPATFVWGEREWLVSKHLAIPVRRSLPSARHVVMPCLGRVLNGSHHRCLAEFIADLLDDPLPPRSGPEDAVSDEALEIGRVSLVRVPCRRGDGEEDGAASPDSDVL